VSAERAVHGSAHLLQTPLCSALWDRPLVQMGSEHPLLLSQSTGRSPEVEGSCRLWVPLAIGAGLGGGW
jgi:hypothetical protein